MTCDGATVEEAITPGGVFTSFHILAATDVIVPKDVEVVFLGTTEPVTTLHVPGLATGNPRRRDLSVRRPGRARCDVGVRT